MNPQHESVLKTLATEPLAVRVRQVLGLTHEQVYESLVWLESRGLARVVVGRCLPHYDAVPAWEAA